MRNRCVLVQPLKTKSFEGIRWEMEKPYEKGSLPLIIYMNTGRPCHHEYDTAN